MDKTELPTGKKWRWSKLILAVSLTLNLLVAGVAVGSLWRADRHAHHDRGDRLIPLVMALPREDRQMLRKEFEAQWSAKRAERQSDGNTQIGQLLIVLRARPFDPVALQQHFDDRMQRHEHQLQIGRNALVARITALSEAERMSYADRLERRSRRWARD